MSESDAQELLRAAEAFVSSLRQGMKILTSGEFNQGVRSQSFSGEADQTAAALRDLKIAITRAKGEPDAVA